MAWKTPKESEPSQLYRRITWGIHFRHSLQSFRYRKNKIKCSGTDYSTLRQVQVTAKIKTSIPTSPMLLEPSGKKRALKVSMLVVIMTYRISHKRCSIAHISCPFLSLVRVLQEKVCLVWLWRCKVEIIRNNHRWGRL